jgi:hypothetical protein
MFGLENIGVESVNAARATVAETMQKLDPLLGDVENRAGGILHGILDRLNGTKLMIEISIPPVPKATAVEPQN